MKKEKTNSFELKNGLIKKINWKTHQDIEMKRMK
jgi:hypothetical protein